MLNRQLKNKNIFNYAPLNKHNKVESLNIYRNTIRQCISDKEYNNTVYPSSNKEYNNIADYPSSIKEWFSSVYSYNYSYLKSLIVFNHNTNKLFSSYFNMFRDKIKIVFKRRRDNKSRYSANKVYLSRAEVKHTNTKLFIILSTFNKQKSTLLKTTRKNIFFKRMYKIIVERKDRYIVKYKDMTTNLLKSLTHKRREFKWVKLVKKGKKKILKIKRFIPTLINRFNHKCNYLFNRKFFAFRK